MPHAHAVEGRSWAAARLPLRIALPDGAEEVLLSPGDDGDHANIALAWTNGKGVQYYVVRGAHGVTKPASEGLDYMQRRRSPSKKDLEALSKSKRALDALRFARSELVEWAKYVPEYFLEKHDFADTLARLDRAFDAAKPNTILIMPLEQAPEEILWERMSIMPIDLGFCLQTQGMSFSVDLSQDPLTVTYPSEDGDPLVIYGLQHKVLAHLKRLGYPSIVTKEPATRFNPPL